MNTYYLSGGFSTDDRITIIKKTKNKINKFVKERNWTESHSHKNFAMSIAIEAAELMEIFQWLSTEEALEIKNSGEFVHLKEELADVLIYCLSFKRRISRCINILFIFCKSIRHRCSR